MLPYRGVPVLLTTWTVCQVCFVPVAHLDQDRHDAAVHPELRGQAEDQPGVRNQMCALITPTNTHHAASDAHQATV